MKIKILILLLIPTFLLSQKYFLLDSLKDYDIKEYTLETKDLYHIDKQINMYNVFVTNNHILLLSILPDLEEQLIFEGRTKQQNWMSIDFESIKNQIFTNEQLITLASEWNEQNTPEKKTMGYKLIKKENGKYYVSKYCLTEFFKIVNIEMPLISSYGVINVEDQKVTIRQMQNSLRKQFPDKNFIMDVRENDFSRDLDVSYNYRNYLSKEITIKKNSAYQFWTFDGWWAQDGYNEHRGIDRFLYIPNKGIVGGSYDFYFRLKPKISSNGYYTIPDNILWENIINEKIMLAKEMK